MIDIIKGCLLSLSLLIGIVYGGPLNFVSSGLGMDNGLGLSSSIGSGLIGGPVLSSGLALGGIKPLSMNSQLSSSLASLKTPSIGLGRSMDFYTPPTFRYGLSDKKNGDKKEHGDVIRGEYSIQEPDGTIRVVKYTADKVNNLNAKALNPEKIISSNLGGLNLEY